MTSAGGAGNLLAPEALVKALLEHNRQTLARRIDLAARAAGRQAEEICVVAITKYVDSETALELARLGQHDLGENRHDRLEAKAAAFHAAEVSVRWHFVGHLQRNKARRVAKVADVIHSVDTPRLIDTLDRAAAEQGKNIEVFLEVLLTDEPEKHGFTPERLNEGLEALRSAHNLRPLGLMGMSGAHGDADSATRAFVRLRSIADELEQNAETAELFHEGRVLTSMGMSGDFDQAISAGADYLRIGTAFFEDDERSLPREVNA